MYFFNEKKYISRTNQMIVFYNAMWSIIAHSYLGAGSHAFIDRFSTDKNRSNTRMSNYRPHNIVDDDHLINLYYLNFLNFNFFSSEKIHFLTLLGNFVFFY